ncbi:hypothetical protein [Nostoc sp. ChiVER01]|uniref:hypothetical protein n=1 Tax=Nostoc sp. ChiVER01 TaxID=3075382 RepID=UPI002AD294E1|nr:hypothetical protein [Nostoc sp. ChiVER01]MDZ8227527.1 hypothetical protein [Nostoc sp. ChiVER01]
MEQLSLAQLFGKGAVQDATKLVIKKEDLALTGLTPTANNRAQQLIVALALQVLTVFQGSFIDENGNLIVDEFNNPISYSNRDNYELLEGFSWGVYLVNGQTDKVRYGIIIHYYERLPDGEYDD